MSEKYHKISTDEYKRAERAEEEVRRFKTGKASQDQRSRGYLDDISRLKKLFPKNASLAIAELESEGTVGGLKHCWRNRPSVAMTETRSRFSSNFSKPMREIIELECILKDPETQSNQTNFPKVLRNAEVDQRHYISLNLSMRQVLVKQRRAVNVRLNDLRTAIQSSERPRKEGLLFVIYQARGDEEAYYDENDPEPKPSSDEDEDEDVTNSEVQRSAPLRLNQPTSRRARPITAPQVIEIPLPVNARVQNDRKRKGNPNDDSEAVL